MAKFGSGIVQTWNAIGSGFGYFINSVVGFGCWIGYRLGKQLISAELLDQIASKSMWAITRENLGGLVGCILAYAVYRYGHIGLAIFRDKIQASCRSIWSRIKSRIGFIISFILLYLHSFWIDHRTVLYDIIHTIRQYFSSQTGLRPTAPPITDLLVRPTAPPLDAPVQALNRRDRIDSDTPAEERLLCIVCWEREKTIMVQGCNHFCMCRECARLVSRGARGNPECPVCRGPINGLIHVFS